MIEPFDKGLLAVTLRYPYEVRDAKAFFEDIPDLNLPDEMKQLAAHMVDTKAGHFDPSKFEDHYEEALIKLLRAKQQERGIKEPAEAPRPGKVVNLMDALRASIEREKAGETKATKRKPAKKRRA